MCCLFESHSEYFGPPTTRARAGPGAAQLMGPPPLPRRGYIHKHPPPPPHGHCPRDVIRPPKNTLHRFSVSGQVQGGGVIIPVPPGSPTDFLLTQNKNPAWPGPPQLARPRGNSPPPPAPPPLDATAPVLRDCTYQGLGMSSLVYATGHINDPVPLIEKRRGLSPGGQFPPSFIHQVIIITGLNKLYYCIFSH